MELGTLERFCWDDLPREKVTDSLSRKVITGEQVMLAHIWLAKGTVVPLHSHEAEQLSYMFSGSLKFIIGGETHVVRPGQVLVIPSGVPHEALALEDTYEMDVFSPIRHDWLEKSDSYFHQPPTQAASFTNPAGRSNPAKLIAWSEVEVESLTPWIDRAYLSGDRSTMADMFLKKGCQVPLHDHESEQMTWVRKGKLRADVGDQSFEVPAGTVLRIPSWMPHKVEALEDSAVIDVFSPRREDWIAKNDAYIRQGNR